MAAETREARQLRYRAGMTALEPTAEWRLPLVQGYGCWEQLRSGWQIPQQLYSHRSGSGQGYAWDGRTVLLKLRQLFGEETDRSGRWWCRDSLPAALRSRPAPPSAIMKIPSVSFGRQNYPLSVTLDYRNHPLHQTAQIVQQKRFKLSRGNLGVAIDEGELANVIQQAPGNGRKFAGLWATPPGETTPRSLIAYANPDGRGSSNQSFSF